MAVCNLLNGLSKETGNFLMFSQYSEDLTECIAKHENYRVVPSKFIVMDVDYSKVKTKLEELEVFKHNDLNEDFPKYLQNYFENSCAYIRPIYNTLEEGSAWYPRLSSNLFWNAMKKVDFFTITKDSDVENEDGYISGIVNEIRYVGEINIQSHDVKYGTGYSEIYCHIPTDTPAYKYKVNQVEGGKHVVNNKATAEGYKDVDITDYLKELKEYYYERSHIFEFDKDFYSLEEQQNKQPDRDLDYLDKYTFNTVIILYDIYTINNENEWVVNENNTNIPLGMYITGMFNPDLTTTNPVTKYITNEDAFGMGTSYGLRICTRFATTSDANIIPIEVSTNQDNYSAFCQVMSEMSETHAMMNTVISNIIKQSQDIKDTLAIFKNNRINVPYIKEINGSKFWFVNGKNMGKATVDQLIGGTDIDYATYENVQDKIDKLEIER